MIAFLDNFLQANQISLLFLIIGLGYLIGEVKIRGFDLGSVAGVLLVGLILGQFNYEISPAIQSLGFTLFIGSVGYQAGPEFFNVLFSQGLKYLVLALVVAGTGFAVALGTSTVFAFEPGIPAGLLAGGMTSTPTLAAAQAAVRAGQVPLPEGWTADEVIGNITTGYAITYIFGLVGLILMIRFLPRLLKVNLPQEAANLERQSINADEAESQKAGRAILTRAYHVTKADLTERRLSRLYELVPGEVTVVRIKRDREFIPVTLDTTLQLGDRVTLVGYLDQLVGVWDALGPEIADDDLLDLPSESAQILVHKLKPKGLTLRKLAISENHGCVLSKMKRLGVNIPLKPNVRVLNGDVLWLTGPQANLERLAERLGYLERQIDETDLITLGLGIAIGGLLGTLAIKVGGLSLGLGSAGGLLTAGLIVGYLRSIRPTFGRVPAGVIWLFTELGLLIFMAGVGLKAGQTLLETLQSVGPTLLISGVLVTCLPVIVGYLFGRYVLRISPVLLIGGITGSMTSGASLKIVISEAKSSMPALGYTGAYAFANVLLTIAGSLIMHL
ncbi:MAG: aspartate:alanine exchanger family transporter [Xenococcus sp. (in: cyanobacteria)]